MTHDTAGARDLLRHAVATLAYRGAKAIRGAPSDFERFTVGPSSRTPGKILAHIGDLLDWALSIAKGAQAWQDSPTAEWERDAQRFFDGLRDLDDYLASEAALGASPEKLLQGPIADALTHVGQLAMLRRLAGAAVKGENYFKADIAAGRVGAEQAAPRREFD